MKRTKKIIAVLLAVITVFSAATVSLTVNAATAETEVEAYPSHIVYADVNAQGKGAYIRWENDVSNMYYAVFRYMDGDKVPKLIGTTVGTRIYDQEIYRYPGREVTYYVRSVRDTKEVYSNPVRLRVSLSPNLMMRVITNPQKHGCRIRLSVTNKVTSKIEYRVCRNGKFSAWKICQPQNCPSTTIYDIPTGLKKGNLIEYRAVGVDKNFGKLITTSCYGNTVSWKAPWNVATGV